MGVKQNIKFFVFRHFGFSIFAAFLFFIGTRNKFLKNPFCQKLQKNRFLDKKRGLKFFIGPRNKK